MRLFAFGLHRGVKCLINICHQRCDSQSRSSTLFPFLFSPSSSPPRANLFLLLYVKVSGGISEMSSVTVRVSSLRSTIHPRIIGVHCILKSANNPYSLRGRKVNIHLRVYRVPKYILIGVLHHNKLNIKRNVKNRCICFKGYLNLNSIILFFLSV